jgi:hypothetical protein
MICFALGYIRMRKKQASQIGRGRKLDSRFEHAIC